MGLRELALVALGGGLGSAARYAVTGLAQRAAGATAWPVGTLTVNVTGSLLIGLFAGLALGRSPPTEGLRLLLVTGVLGGYTTFSAFSLENLLLLRQGALAVAAGNAALQVLLGLAAAAAGFALARAVAPA